jgi:hypothetical protein
MADYCSSSDIVARIPESGLASSTAYDDSIAALITAASRAIDKDLGRWPDFFYPSTADGTYYYHGDDTGFVWIDEFVSITSVSISESAGVASTDYVALAAADYYVYPENNTPIRGLTMDALNGSYAYWPAYRKSIKVVGVRGWSASPPADIVEACVRQTVLWWMQAKQGYQSQGGNPATGAIVYNYTKLDQEIARLLNNYTVELMG